MLKNFYNEYRNAWNAELPNWVASDASYWEVEQDWDKADRRKDLRYKVERTKYEHPAYGFSYNLRLQWVPDFSFS